MNAPFSYYGGKRYMVKTLIPMFPDHTAYVELFGGSGVLLLNKRRSKVETYNDIDEHLVDFYRVIQDEDDLQRFMNLMDVTPYSRTEHKKYRKTWREQTDRVEKVRQWYTVIRSSFNGLIDANWTYATVRNKANMMLETVDRLPEVARRLRGVQLDNREWHEVFDDYDQEGTFFYMDPPYVLSSRTSGEAYQHEMDDEDHVDIVDRLKETKSKVMLSGYDNEIYNKLGWERIDYEVKSRAPLQTGTDNPRKTESVWINYSLSSITPQQELF